MCMVPLLGGHFEGKITGDVLPGGADTQWLKPDGSVSHIDARYMIKTNDGAIIYIHNPVYGLSYRKFWIGYSAARM